MNRSSTADAAVVSAVVPRASARPRQAFRYGVPALAAAVLTGGSGQLSAQELPDPAPNHVWAGCKLSQEAVEEIQQSIVDSSSGFEGGEGFGSPSDVEVTFVVVYSLQENDGQELVFTDGDFTGPILCAGGEPSEGLIPSTIETTTEDSPIPDPSTGADSVNILDLEEALILRYEPFFDGVEPFTGQPEKRFCHTVDDNTDCFTVLGPDNF